MLGAIALGAFALRSRISVSGSQVQDLGVLGDRELSYQRFRLVIVSRLGPLSVWAPQLDDEAPRGPYWAGVLGSQGPDSLVDPRAETRSQGPDADPSALYSARSSTPSAATSGCLAGLRPMHGYACRQ